MIIVVLVVVVIVVVVVVVVVVDDPTIVGEETELLSCLSDDNCDWQENYTVNGPN